ncbi:DUF6584 family protein [Aurantiacibacter suaedae]|uniref:DUF6584 family protein n=1 Tax=Aurantiacibacter suaedae TaxID=2545755 RepID=UPI0010F688BE|nr:DUF6584 family protein [Aurantiacibacter suaedae]
MKRALCLTCLALVVMAKPALGQDVAVSREEQLERVERDRAEGDLAAAGEGLERLLARYPDDPDLLRRLASVRAAQGDLDQAQTVIDRALALAPEDLDIQLARANILLWRGQRLAAQQQAEAIALVAPDYPELGLLEARLAQDDEERGMRLTALNIGGGVSEISFDNRSGEVWSSQIASLGLSLGSASGASVTLEREERATTDVRLSARLDRRFGRHAAYISGSVVPDADFRESWSIGAGGELALSDRLTALVDMRYADYRDRTVFALQPGVRFVFGDAVSLTARAINLLGGGEDYRLGGSLQFDYRPEDRLGGFVVLASYPDVEADGVRQLRSAATGLLVPLGNGITLSTVGAYEDRENSYRRLSGTLVLGFRFGAR